MSGAGIYAIVNKLSGARYVGSSIDMHRRERHHRRLLRGGQHHCAPLQRAWNACGEDGFVFIVLEHCDPSGLQQLEQLYLDSVRHDYNVALDAFASMRGRKQSADHIAKRVAKQVGQKRTAEQRERMSAAHRGYSHSPETKAKIAAANGTPEARLAAREAQLAYLRRVMV